MRMRPQVMHQRKGFNEEYSAFPFSGKRPTTLLISLAILPNAKKKGS